MFKIAATRTFTHDVTVMTPVDGGHVEEVFKCTFNYLDIDETSKFDLNTRDGTTAMLKAIIRKLDDIADENDKPLPYSDVLRDQVIKLDPVRRAILVTYFDAFAKAKLGN